MTERKPPDASVGSWVEFQIRRAQARGEFDDLRGHGKPIADLHQPHDELWWVKRKLRDENVSSVPPRSPSEETPWWPPGERMRQLDAAPAEPWASIRPDPRLVATGQAV